MAASLDDLACKFESFEDMMKQTLDKLSGFEAWRSTADDSLGSLLTKTSETASRLQRLESTLPPPPPSPPVAPHRPQTAPPPPPPRWVNPIDLNVAPQQAACPSASALERPSGHDDSINHRDDGGGILGAHPPRPITGMSTGTQLPPESHSEGRGCSYRSGQMPKLEFPKFDGENPRLWADHYEMYFELFSVSDSLKTRFAALNFNGAAASWLQT